MGSQTRQSSGNIHHLDHAGLPATDTERAEKFYTDILEGQVIDKGPCLEGGGARVFIKLGQTHVGLFSKNGVRIPTSDILNSYPRYSFLVPEAHFGRIMTKVYRKGIFTQTLTDKSTLRDCGIEHGLLCADSEGNLLELFRTDREEEIRLHHVHIDTLDLDTSIHFHNTILGLEVIRSDSDTATLRIATDQRLILHRTKELSITTKTEFLETHVGFTVTNQAFHEIVNNLRKAQIDHKPNLTIVVPRKPNELTTYFKDPMNGYHLQIINQDSEAFTKSRSKT